MVFEKKTEKKIDKLQESIETHRRAGRNLKKMFYGE